MIYDGLVNKLTDKTSVNENYDLFSNMDSIKVLSESTNIILESNRNVKIPQELQLTDDDLLGSVSAIDSKVKKIIKYLEDNLKDESDKIFGRDKSKIISDNLGGIYLGLVGVIFYGKEGNKYTPKMSWYVGILNKYCNEKTKSFIKKDIERTITSFEKMQKMKKELNNIQKAWLKDISDNVNKIK